MDYLKFSNFLPNRVIPRYSFGFLNSNNSSISNNGSVGAYFLKHTLLSFKTADLKSKSTELVVVSKPRRVNFIQCSFHLILDLEPLRYIKKRLKKKNLRRQKSIKNFKTVVLVFPNRPPTPRTPSVRIIKGQIVTFK